MPQAATHIGAATSLNSVKGGQRHVTPLMLTEGSPPGRRRTTMGSSNSHTRCGCPSGTSRAKCTCGASGAPLKSLGI